MNLNKSFKIPEYKLQGNGLELNEVLDLINPKTEIKYELPKDGFIKINVYDLMGRNIKTLVNKIQIAGNHSVTWNATNNSGGLVSAGMYIYTIQAGAFSQTRKMILLK